MSSKWTVFESECLQLFWLTVYNACLIKSYMLNINNRQNSDKLEPHLIKICTKSFYDSVIGLFLSPTFKKPTWLRFVLIWIHISSTAVLLNHIGKYWINFRWHKKIKTHDRWHLWYKTAYKHLTITERIFHCKMQVWVPVMLKSFLPDWDFQAQIQSVLWGMSEQQHRQMMLS